nr:Omp28-related outer membrane protein [FCB group bacterium]
MNWPGAGNDPFYMYNPTDNMARKNYYGIAGTPSMKCDGILSPSPTNASLNSALSQRSPVDAPVDIYFDITVGTNIAVDAEVTAESYFSGNNLKFHAVLIGESIDTSGTAGWLQSHFEDVMLDMAPSASGQSFNISQSQTVELQASFPIPAITSIENLAVIAFVQNDATREILNARHMVLFPSLTVYQTFVFDMAGGNGNMIPEAGETCDLWVTLENSVNGAYASDVNCILSTDDPDITITDGDASFGDIGPGAFVMNADNAFVFDVSAVLQPHVATFELEITANAGDYYKLETFNLMVGIPEILLVDDDSGNNYELEIINSLTQANFAFDQWTAATSGAPSAQYLLNYDKVIWITGRADHPLNEAEQAAISGYLDGGGKLLISSENLSDDLTGSDFLTNYMHCQHDIDNVNINFLNGVTGDPITDGMTIDMTGGAYLPDDQSSIIPDAEAVTILRYDN